MQKRLLDILSCPVNRSGLQLQVLAISPLNSDCIEEGILFSGEDWFYPVIKGIPRLIIEAFLDYEPFFRQHLPDYTERKHTLEKKYSDLIRHVVKKNTRTKKSFAFEWNFFDYNTDKTWNHDTDTLLEKYLAEINETQQGLQGKMIFDAGCGNGLLSNLSAANGATVVAMDFSPAIERTSAHNNNDNVFFIQGDVQFPPVKEAYFDIVYCSGVLIHTNNTELSFSRIAPMVKPGGKLSVWLYHPRKNAIHNTFNFIRRFTSKLPLKMQFYLYAVTLFPASYIVKRLRGNKQNAREMMLEILDWFSPEFRWEHEHDEAAGWFRKRNFSKVEVTTTSMFGFSITGIKNNIGNTK